MKKLIKPLENKEYKRIQSNIENEEIKKVYYMARKDGASNDCYDFAYVPTLTFYTSEDFYLALETDNHFIKVGIDGIEILKTLDKYKNEYKLFETATLFDEDDYYEEEISIALVGEKLLSYKTTIKNHCLQFENLTLSVYPYNENEKYCFAPYDYPIHCFDRLLTRKCSCGGNGEVILVEMVNDYLIRCDKCHKSTYADWPLRCVITDWNNNETPINVKLDFESFFEDVEKGVDYISFSDSGYYKYGNEHFDCEYVIVSTKAVKYSIRSISFRNLTTGFAISGFADCNEEYAKERIVSEKDKPIIFSKKSPLVLEFLYGDKSITIFSHKKECLKIGCTAL